MTLILFVVNKEVAYIVIEINKVALWTSDISEKLMVSQLISIYSALYGIPNVHFHFHRSPSLVSILSQIYQLSLGRTFNINLGMLSGYMSSDFPTKTAYEFLVAPVQ